MYRYQDYSVRTDEPLMVLSTYRMDKRYREAAQDRLITVAGSPEPAHRLRFRMRVKRVGAGLRIWCLKCIRDPKAGTRIQGQAAPDLAAER